MAKKRERNSDEFWRGKFREVEKLNRQLRKRIKQLEKSEHIFEDVILGEKEIEYEEVKIEKTCTECGKGKLTAFNILDRIFEECNICDYRKKISGPK